MVSAHVIPEIWGRVQGNATVPFPPISYSVTTPMSTGLGEGEGEGIIVSEQEQIIPDKFHYFHD